MKWVQCFCHFSGWIGGIQRCRRTWQINNKWQKLDSNLGLSNYILCCKPLCYTVWQVNNTHTKLFSILAVFTVIELNYALLCKHQGIFIYKDFLSDLKIYMMQKRKEIYTIISNITKTQNWRNYTIISKRLTRGSGVGSELWFIFFCLFTLYVLQIPWNDLDCLYNYKTSKRFGGEVLPFYYTFYTNCIGILLI